MLKEKNRVFREMLNSPGMIVAPGVYDAIGARVVQASGFQAFYMTGNGTSASRLGLPDIGLATANEMAAWANNLSSCVDIPLICDSDNGYGGVLNTWRSVRAFEDAGVSAIHIEDQDFPKKCGCYEGVKLVDEEVAVERIKIALQARRDPDFVIIARTDARRAHNSLDEAIRRGRKFANAGADVVFFEQLESKDEIAQVTRSISNAPVMYDILEERPDLIYSIKEIENLGVKICIFALTSVLYAAQSMMDVIRTIKETGTTKSLISRMMNLHVYEDLMGIKTMQEIEKGCKT